MNKLVTNATKDVFKQTIKTVAKSKVADYGTDLAIKAMEAGVKALKESRNKNHSGK